MTLGELLHGAADTLPVWRPLAVALLAGLVVACIGLVVEMLGDR